MLGGAQYLEQLQAPAVPDGTPFDAALRALLANSGLGYEFINDRTVRIFETAAGNKRTSAVTPAATASTGALPAAAQAAGDVGEILVARGGTIRGRVVDSSNTPRGACEVVLELRNAGQTLPRWTRSKSDGSFQFRTVPPGVHLVRSARRSSAGDAEPNDRESGVRGQLVSVEEGGEVADLELSVEP